MKKEDQNEHAFRYAALIQAHLADMLSEDSESDYKISLDEFKDEQKATAFLHALTNIVPCNIYKKLTGDDVDILGFNHIANRLVCQFSKAE